jgi:hypothetical protein
MLRTGALCGLLVSLLTVMSCSSGPYMGLHDRCARSDCYNFQRGLTQQEFLGQRNPDDGHRSSTYRKGDDVWDVWVYVVSETIGSSAVSTPPAVDPPATLSYADHEEYVAFKNGRLEEWGRGTLPRVLKNDPHRVAVQSMPKSD